MRRKVAAVWVSLLIMISSIVILVEIAERVEAPTTLYVGGGGPGNYSKIQDAINASSDGDTVFVYNGTYYENVVVNKTINLTGEDRDTTLIDGGGSGDVVYISVNGSNIKGFTIKGSGGAGGSDYNAGIDINIHQNCLIEDNIFTNNRYGIWIDKGTSNTINENIAFNNDYGIWVRDSSDTMISNNIISNNTWAAIYLVSSIDITLISNTMINDGIMISGSMSMDWVNHNIGITNTVNGKPIYYWKNQNTGTVPAGAGQVILANCNNIEIKNQNVSDTSSGVLVGFSTNNYIANNTAISNNINGIEIYKSHGNTLDNNNCSNDENIGIQLSFSSNNIIINNTIESNKWRGIRLWSSDDNTIMTNNISLNNDYGIFLEFFSNNNLIYHNNIINNVKQAYDNAANNFWNDTYPSGGNYWSDYIGVDLNSTPTQDVPPPDGIGDTPYVIDGNSKDNYPLMETVFQSTPSEPRNLQAPIRNSYANLSWETPLIEGSSAIIGYNIYKNGTTGVYVFVPSSQLWFNDTGLINGMNYTYNVLAINSNGEGPNATISVTPGTIPSEPENLQIDEGYGYMNISWETPISYGGYSIIDYKIYRNGTIGPYATLPLGQLWFNDTNVINGTSYTYNITASNVIGEGPNTNNIVGTPIAPTAPSAPQNPQTESGDSVVNITWDPPLFVGGLSITEYNIYRNGTIGIFVSVPSNHLWFIDTNVINDLFYTYNITAVNSIGEGIYSIDVMGTPSVPSVPSAPGNLQTEEGDQFINLIWEIPVNDGNSPILGYNIYRNGTVGVYGIVPASQLFYLDVNVNNGITYIYNISSYNAIGESIRSNDIAATPKSLASAPQNLQIVNGDSYLNLSWDAPLDDGGFPITGYNIYRNDTTVPFNTISANELWYLDNLVNGGITYTYRVSAITSVGEGLLSNELSEKAGMVPLEPTNVKANAGDSYNVLTWEVPISDRGYPVTNYTVFRGETQGEETYLNKIGNILSYNDTDVTNGVTYYYKVIALNNIGEGLFSLTVNATPEAIIIPINQIPTCSISSPFTGSTIKGNIEINGTASDSDGEVQKVEIKIDEGSWIQVDGTTFWSYSLNTTSLSNGEHTVSFRAFDGTNYSSENQISIQINNPQPKTIEEKSIFEESWFLAIIILIIIVILILILLSRRKKDKSETEIEKQEEQDEDVNEEKEDTMTSEDESDDIEDEREEIIED